MAARSKIKKLPRDTLAKINKFLAEQDRSVDDFTQFLVDEIGLEISRTAAHRYQQSFEKIAEHGRRSSEIAAALCEEMGPEMAAGKTGRLLNQILQNIVFDHLVDRVENDDRGTAQELMQLARAIKDTVATLKLNAETEAKLREEARREALAEAAEMTDQLGREAGISEETRDAWRRKVLGMGDAA